ncbi:MAG: nitroreductase [Acidimicrobiales bacterium]|nr:nitroreductase [Acidimicrobiales bacterium]
MVRHQRAHRRFDDRPVDDDLVERCLEAATRAPSAENKQPWEFIVVRDPERRAAIGELTRDAWRAGGRAHSEGRLPAHLLAEVDDGAEGGVAAAPVLVVVCGNAERGLPSTLPASVFPAVQNLLLAAGALGLGSAMTTLALQRADALRVLLALPDHVTPMAIVPLGWPARPLGPSRREPVAERAHRERWGEPW